MPNQERVHLLVIADLSPPIQGISIVTDWILEQLCVLGFHIKVINTTVNKTYFYKFRRIYKFFVTFVKLISMKNFSTLYIPLSHGESLLFQTIFVYLGYLRRKTIIVHHHSYLPIKSPAGILHKISHGTLLRKAEHVFLSEKMKNDYLGVWGETNTKYWVISNHDVAKSRLNSENHKFREENSLTFIHFGNLSLEKGFFEVVEACEPYLKSDPKSQFKLLGSTSNIRIINAIEGLKSKYPNQFSYSDQYSPDLLRRNLSDSDILLFPSHYKNEASPIVILEAQTMGVLVAATDIGTIRSEVIHPGFSVQIANYQDELSKLVKCLLPPDTRNLLQRKVMDEMIRLSIRAQDEVREVFAR
jgi:glycosyltransferase involved in cell wall biosynthesis